MALDLPLRKTSAGQQALSFLEPKIWTKINHSTKNVKTTASFTHTLKREVFSKLCRQTSNFIYSFSLIKTTYFS